MFIAFLALLDCVSVRPSVKRAFSETFKQINAKFCGKVAIHHISRPFFSVFKHFGFLNFNIFISFSLTWMGPGTYTLFLP